MSEVCSGSSGLYGSWALLSPDDLQGDVLELGEQGAELFRVVEQGLVFGGVSRRVVVLSAILRVHSA